MTITTTSQCRWVEKPKRLKLALGSVLLYAPRFRALVFDGFYGDLSPDAMETPIPLEQYPLVRCALVESHPIKEPLPRASKVGNLIRYVPAQYRRFYVDLEGSFEDYLRRFSSTRRKHLRQAVKHFTAASGGQIEWREYCRPHEMAEYYRLAREVSRNTYQENLADAGLPEGEAFLQQITQRAERGAQYGYILFHQGKPVAYQHCPSEDRVLMYERVGYDPEYRHLSPGVTLFYLVLQHLFESRRFSRFDFGKGEFPYKETFATGWRHCADIYYFRRSPANYALVFAHGAVKMLSQALAGVLGHLRMKDRLKRMVRLRYGTA